MVASDIDEGDFVRYGGRGSALRSDERLCRWAWLFGRWMEGGFHDGENFCLKAEKDVVAWLDEGDTRYWIVDDVVKVAEDVVSVKAKVVANST